MLLETSRIKAARWNVVTALTNIYDAADINILGLWLPRKHSSLMAVWTRSGVWLKSNGNITTNSCLTEFNKAIFADCGPCVLKSRSISCNTNSSISEHTLFTLCAALTLWYPTLLVLKLVSSKIFINWDPPCSHPSIKWTVKFTRASGWLSKYLHQSDANKANCGIISGFTAIKEINYISIFHIYDVWYIYLHVCNTSLVIAFKRVCEREAKFKRNGTVANFWFFVSSSIFTSSCKLHWKYYRCYYYLYYYY